MPAMLSHHLRCSTTTTMMLRLRIAAAAAPGLTTSLASRRPRGSVARRFKEGGRPDLSDLGLDQQQAAPRSPTATRLSPEQLEEIYNKEPGSFSPRTAEMRADLGDAVIDLSQVQTFDGPIPETVNGRLAALGIVLSLAEEYFTGNGLLQQAADHPFRILLISLVIAFASYAPVVRGYTRKEPFANSFLGLPWIPAVENVNGRVAMLGFVAQILTEAVTGVNTLQAWGLQPVAHAVTAAATTPGAGIL